MYHGEIKQDLTLPYREINMNTRTMASIVAILSMSISTFLWAENPCMPIAKACMDNGYYKGGNKVGKGLVENCVMPMVTHQKTLGNVTFSDDVLNQCHALLQQKLSQ